MEKPWLVISPADNYEEDFATEDDALADAEKVIQLFREEAHDEGEWNEEVEFVKVYRLCHEAQVTKREEGEDGVEAVEYGMVPVPQPHITNEMVADWAIRHNIQGGLTELRAMVEDAATILLA